MSKKWSAILAVLCASAALPATASAGTYTVFTCMTPQGGASHVDWQRGARHSGMAPTYFVTNGCPSRGFAFGFDGAAKSHTANDYVTYRFHAPSDTAIEAFSLWRSVRLAPSYNMYLSVRDAAGHQIGDFLESCVGSCDSLGDPGSPLSAANLVSGSGLRGVGRLQVTLSCGLTDSSSSRCTTGPAGSSYRIHRADVTLRDDLPPRLEAAPEGPLLEGDRPLVGRQHVWISASDRGSGVYEVLFEVDGTIVDRAVIDDNGGECRPPYKRARPCKLSVSAPVSFDTARIPDGQHLLRLLVTDATGTNVAPWGTFHIVTANASCNPRPSVPDQRVRLRFAGRRSTRVRITRYGRRSNVKGVLTTAAGSPLPNAQLCVAAENPGARHSYKQLTTVTTDARGHFAFRLPRGPSRRVFAVYRTARGAAAASVRVRVRAAARLKASRKRLRNGDRVVLRGRLRGGHVPRGGVLIELQARRGKRWQTFGTTNARRDGRFSFGYRFTRTAGVQRYKLRARVPRQAGYPYLAGASRPVTVTVVG